MFGGDFVVDIFDITKLEEFWNIVYKLVYTSEIIHIVVVNSGRIE